MPQVQVTWWDMNRERYQEDYHWEAQPHNCEGMPSRSGRLAPRPEHVKPFVQGNMHADVCFRSIYILVICIENKIGWPTNLPGIVVVCLPGRTMLPASWTICQISYPKPFSWMLVVMIDAWMKEVYNLSYQKKCLKYERDKYMNKSYINIYWAFKFVRKIKGGNNKYCRDPLHHVYLRPSSLLDLFSISLFP